MHERYIATSGGLYGNWGNGDTVEDAKKNLRKAGGKIKGCKLWKFTSQLPFAPTDKQIAEQAEADCWIGRDGSMSWVRCQREEMENT